MPGVPVHLDRPPFSARLIAWGKASDGWWGLIEWAQTIREDGALSSSSFAAWVPAASLSRPGWSGPGSEPNAIARLSLPPRRLDWPGPAAWSGWYAGAWPSGRLATPDGVEVVNGPAWRRR